MGEGRVSVADVPQVVHLSKSAIHTMGEGRVSVADVPQIVHLSLSPNLPPHPLSKPNGSITFDIP